MTTWREAVWAAVQRQASASGEVTRQALIERELDTICREVDSTGLTPGQTLTRTLNELRIDGVLLADSRGHYRVAAGLAARPLEEAVATESWKLQRARVGQSGFRKALIERWSGCCPLTGIAEPPLLRASHIVPWNRCQTDRERLDPDNGLLLSALWDAAFDAGLVSFANDGTALPSTRLADATFDNLCGGRTAKLANLTAGNRERLCWHRAEYQFA